MKIEALADADAASVAARGRFIIPISGGRTPWKMLRALADEPMPWAGITCRAGR